MIATVVLAAGRSERFGSPKLLAEWWGRPLVERALEIAPPGLKVAVVGTHTAKLLPVFQAHGFQCIRNPKPAQGQSSSLRLALDVMPAEVDAVLVLLGDAPAVPPAVIERMLTAYRRLNCAVTSSYEDRTAPPVIIPRADWDKIAATGDSPGAALDPVAIDMSDLLDGGEDVDTPEDLFALSARRAGVDLLEPADQAALDARLDDPEPFAVRLRRRNTAGSERLAVTPLALEKLAIEHFRGTEVIARVGDEYVSSGWPGSERAARARAARPSPNRPRASAAAS
jgi:molybdenum cofactor cytidylyltransferase